MRRTRKTVAGGLALTIGLLLSACGGDSPEAADRNSDPIVGGNLVDLATFGTGQPPHTDPAQVNDFYQANFVSLLFDGLTAVDDDGVAQPAVAESFSSNDDATVWTFKLRDDVEFSDGSPVLASSFKRGWQRVLQPSLEADTSYLLAEFQASEDDLSLDNVVVDDEARTLEITLPQTDRDLPALVSLVQFSPMPEGVPTEESLDNQQLVGNGPFVMDGPVVEGDSIKVSRNEGYFGGLGNHKAYLDSIEFKINSDETAAYNDFAAGNGQVGAFPATATADLQRYQSEDILNDPTLGVEVWGFNMQDPTVGGDENLKLRQAIDLAIDKKAINEDDYGNGREVATQFSTPTTPGSDAKADEDGSPDIDGAKRLLEEWGKTPPEITVSFNAGSEHDSKAELIAENLKAVGIPAKTEAIEIDPFVEGLTNRSLQFFRYAWVADYPSYRSMIEPSFTSSNDGLTNFSAYDNSEVDELFAQAQDESDTNARNDLYKEAEAKIMADQPFIPIVWTTAQFIKAPEVKNLTVDSLGTAAYENVWLDPNT